MLTLTSSDVLSDCPRCGGQEFVRASLFSRPGLARGRVGAGRVGAAAMPTIGAGAAAADKPAASPPRGGAYDSVQTGRQQPKRSRITRAPGTSAGKAVEDALNPLTGDIGEAAGASRPRNAPHGRGAPHGRDAPREEDASHEEDARGRDASPGDAAPGAGDASAQDTIRQGAVGDREMGGGVLSEAEPIDTDAWLARVREQLSEREAPGEYLVYEESGELRTVPLTREWTRIGRSLAADVRFDDPTVSRRHALIVRQPDGVRVLDDRSLNGVFVNGSRVEWKVLDDGDEIVVGRYRLRFLSLAPRAAADIPAASAPAASD